MLCQMLISLLLGLFTPFCTGALVRESQSLSATPSSIPSSSTLTGTSGSSALSTSERGKIITLLTTLPESYLRCPPLNLFQVEADFVNLYFLRRPDSSGKCKAAIALFKQTLGPPYTLAVQNLSGGFRGLPIFLEFRRGRWLDVTKRVLPSFVLRLERPKIKSRLARDGSGLLVAPFDETDDFSKPLYTLEWKRGHFWPLEMKTSSQVFRP